jgi:seryl-tRNA synthetase
VKYGTNGFRSHFELVEMIDGIEFGAGHAIAGNRAYFLKGPLVLLNQALLNYGLAFLSQKGSIPLQPPFFMNKDVMAKTAELDDYDDVLYKVVEDPERPELDKYMIATSEQPISALYMNQNIDKKALPQRFVGISSCFRREAGSSGRDIRGIFRVHQFEKIEQFNVVGNEAESWEEHDRMIKQAEEFYQSLELPYHVVAIVSGEINNAASKKYDLEAWFPGDNEGKGKYRELVSCSNCLDYQSRSLNVIAGFANDKDKCFAYMLNSTLCATERAMCCILENYQTA